MRFTVRDVMTVPVIAVRKGASFKEVAERLREHRVSAFPQAREGSVYGLLADGTTIEIRPATPDDFQAVKAMYSRFTGIVLAGSAR